MELLFALLTAFTLTPRFESYDYTEKDVKVMKYLIQESGYSKECNITGPVGATQQYLALHMDCRKDGVMYRAKMGIDLENKLYVRVRY